MLLIVVMVTQFVFIGNDARIIDLTLQMRAKVLIGAVSAIASMVLAIVAMAIMDNDIVAMCIGVILGRMILTVAYPLQIGKLLDRSPAAKLRGIPRPALTTLVLFAASTWLGQRVTAGTWVALVLWGARPPCS